ncbi:hypothetical protein SGCOL_001608 [Colletotrichum sp. CLE4]
MSAPLVFKGREVAMTQNELAASSAAAKVNSAESEDENEPIPKVESDFAEPAGAPEKSAGRKRQSSQPAASKASKRRKRLEGQEPLAESSQSVQASIENQLSSQYATPETASPAGRHATRTGKPKKAAPAANKALPLDASDSDERGRPNDHGSSDTERDDASPPPVQAPKKRGRPRKALNAVSAKSKKPAGKPVPAEPVTKATTLRRSTRASTIEKAVPEKKKKAATTHGRGVARPKKTTKNSPAKGVSDSPTYSEEFYDVEKIVGARVDPKTKMQMYMVKWRGYGSSQNTWEPKGNLGKCAALIKSFNASQNGGKGNK